MNTRLSASSARRFALLSLTVLSLGAAAGCSKPTAKADDSQTPSVSVETTEVSNVEAPQTLRLTGTLHGSKETDLAANVAGRIQSTSVERGSEVKAGTVVATVDVRAAALSLAEARVAVATSKTQQQINAEECARYEQLKARGAVSQQEFDAVTAKCKTAPLNLEAAQAREMTVAKNVGDGVIRAPFSGVVSERYVEVGEYVQSASKVVSIAQVDELKLEFSVPEANWPDVKDGADVAFRVAAYGDKVFHGKVIHVAGAVRATRDVVVEALVSNADKKLLPGMFADIDLVIGAKPMPSVPVSAVFMANGKQNVYVKTDGQLEQRTLQTQAEVGGRIPVLKGVAIGEKVVTVVTPNLSNGLRVH